MVVEIYSVMTFVMDVIQLIMFTWSILFPWMANVNSLQFVSVYEKYPNLAINSAWKKLLSVS